MIEEKDRLLLSHLQKGLPLVSQPFAFLGAKIGTDPVDVLLRIEKLRKDGLLSGIKALWDGRALHYQSAWAAMSFNKKDFASKAEIITGHSGVIYAAEMESELNCWFFLAVPAGHDLESHVRILEKQTAPQECVFLPLRKVLKGSNLLHFFDDRVYGSVSECFEKRKTAERVALSLEKIRVIRAMQQDLPVTDEPYQRMAEALEMPAGHFLDILNELFEEGYLKRIGPHLAAKRSVAKPRTLVAWKIPDEKLDKSAEIFLEIPEIVYADTRPEHAAFVYSVHTLIEAKDSVELEVLVRRIEDRIGKWPHVTVPVVRELKKMPVKYFPKELEAWWARYRSMADTAFNHA